MPERIARTIGDLGILFDGPHATPKRMNSGPYFLSISSLINGRLDLSQSDHVSEEDFVKWTRRVTPQANDLLFSYETRLGEAALMPPGIQATLGRRMALIRPHTDVVFPAFLLYLYLSPQIRDLITVHTIHGATVNRIGLSKMGRWPVEIPGLFEQRAIAEVLGALDDKIAANAKVKKAALQLAATTYQGALVGGPTRKVELRSVAQNVPGKYLSKDKYVSDGDYLVFGSNSEMGRHDTALVPGAIAVLAKIGSYCGNLRWSERPSWINNNASAIVPNTFISPWILRHALDRLDMGPHRAGTGQPYIRMESLFSAVIELPSLELSASIASLLEDLSNVEVIAEEENRTLAATRDALLPQLMSGKLRVRDAEKAVEAVV
jgi:type I restriction enzyme S subunit